MILELNSLNLNDAIMLQKTLFPLENGEYDLISCFEKSYAEDYKLIKYWLLQLSGKYVGMIGMYVYNEYPNDAWLGWFGIVKDERRKGYGTLLYKAVLDFAQKSGFKNLRLYTDEIDNVDATKFYEHMGMQKEVYDLECDEHFEVGKTLIYSVSLSDKKVKKWNNKNLFLKEHEERNS